MIDAARPGLNLSNQFPITAIPADTVRAVEQAQLYSEINYRPSTTTTLSHRLELLDQPQQQQLLALMAGQSTTKPPNPLSARDKARQLELGYDLLLYRIRADGEARDSRTGLAYSLLKQRSELEHSAEWPEAPPPTVRAEQGHLSSRAAFSIGVSDRQRFAALHFRPAYHDILDPAQGYGVGMQINFFDFNVRYYEEQQRVDLEEWKIINILSLSPRNAFFSPISWGVDFGIQRQWFNNDDIHPLQVTGQAGVSYRLGRHWQGSVMGQIQLAAHRQFHQQLNAGAGPLLSLLHHHETLHSELLISGFDFPGSDQYQSWKLSWQLNLPIAAQQGIRLRLERKHQDQHYGNEVELAWRWYF